MKKRVYVILAAAIVLITTLCIFIKKNEPEKIYMSASWIYGYANVEELTEHSDLIALVKVDKLAENIEGKVPASIYNVTVIDGILGCKKDEVIPVYMTGGKNGNQTFEIKSDPLMKKRQQFLIFAQKNQDGTYTILGGPQGRLVYSKGMLNSLKNTELPYANAKSAKDTAELSKFDGLVNVQNESLEEVKEKIHSVLAK